MSNTAPTYDPSYMIEITKGKINDLEAAKEVVRLASAQNAPIVFHFHGGLISKNAAVHAAIEDSPFYRTAPSFPIYPIWKTGPVEVLPEVVGTIALESLFKIILDRVIGFGQAHVSNALGMKGSNVVRTLPKVNEAALTQSSLTEKGDFSVDFLNSEDFERLLGQDDLALTTLEERSIQRSIERDIELISEIDSILAGRALIVPNNQRSAAGLSTISVPKESKADQSFLEEFHVGATTKGIGIQTGIAIVKIIGRFIKRFIDGKGHGVHATAVEEILREVYGSYVGTIAWSTMKRYTEVAMDDDGASTEILNLLREVPEDQRIVLVGHSAGAIFISNFLNRAGQMGVDQKFEVILLAPAVRAKTFNEGVLKNLNLIRKYDQDTYCMRMFTMSDGRETRDVLVRNIPHLGDLT